MIEPVVAVPFGGGRRQLVVMLQEVAPGQDCTATGWCPIGTASATTGRRGGDMLSRGVDLEV